MKFFAIFAAVVAVAVARPGTSTWTLEELSDALQNPNIDPELVPILEHALNEIMSALHSGEQLESVFVPLPADVAIVPSPELSDALQNPNVDPALVPILEHALNEIMTALHNGEQLESVFVPLPADVSIVPSPVVPAPVVPSPAPSSPLVQIIVNVKSQQQVGKHCRSLSFWPSSSFTNFGYINLCSSSGCCKSHQLVHPRCELRMKFFTLLAAIVAVALARPGTSTWTLQELSDALQNPNVNPAVVPFLEHALNELMSALHNGHEFESIHVPLPADIPVIAEPVIPSPVDIPAVSSPLVQLIINVKCPQQVTDVGTAPPADVPGPDFNPIDVIAVNPIEV
ncbi:uncharacterized protein LOC125070654 [Vanessa atalanta]|uniref:uncharacterized protein LOC125070654 n=1 Tax=Vanessa atalanta TaxID=42275 RepID=UPI001FCD8A3D|nr:uncharacterized protein LOC125070654 [Vanessa atalanta]